MADFNIENIVAYAEVTNGFDIEYLANKLDEIKYNPNDFDGAVIQFDDPRIAVLILSNGKIVFTGAKQIYDVESVLQRVIIKLKNIGLTIDGVPVIKVQNIVSSMNLNLELDLAAIAEHLQYNDFDYNPEEFPGLVYRINDMDVVILLFRSGKIVCTGTKNMDDLNKAFIIIKEKLTEIGIY